MYHLSIITKSIFKNEVYPLLKVQFLSREQ